MQEAVYRSRGAQAGRALFAPGAKGGCGLGKEAAVVLDLTPKAEQLFETLWPQGLDGAQLEYLRTAMSDWVQAQDQLDRDRNHFLKAFRSKHGASRSDYSPEVLVEFESGLEAVNSRALQALAAAARSIQNQTSQA